jgi:hypothetical protein
VIVSDAAALPEELHFAVQQAVGETLQVAIPVILKLVDNRVAALMVNPQLHDWGRKS